MVPPCGDAIAVASIVLSAGTYLFDFGSNVVVLVEYSTRFMRIMHRKKEGISSCDAVCHGQAIELAGFFYALLSIMASCHTLNALLFQIKFTSNDGAPLIAAYFLPLVHLYRLSHLLWRTLSCKGIEDLRSPEINGLYCILGSAMEGVPMLIVQLCGYLLLAREGVFLHSMSTTFKVSVAASLAAAAYNGGTSVQSMAKNAATLKQKLSAAAIGASFTLSATILRCLTFIYIVVYIQHEYFWRQRITVREHAKFHVSDFIQPLITAGSIVAYSLYFWLLGSPRSDISKSLRNPRRLITALAFSFVSMNLGPLYPLISQANDARRLGCRIFRLRLLALCLLHLLLDLAVLGVTNMLVTLPKPYVIVSSLTVVGYIVCLLAYMRFDAGCGPMASSINVSIEQAPTCTHSIPLSELCTSCTVQLLVANAHSQESETEEDEQYLRRDVDLWEANGGCRWPQRLTASLSVDHSMAMIKISQRSSRSGAWPSSFRSYSENSIAIARDY